MRFYKAILSLTILFAALALLRTPAAAQIPSDKLRESIRFVDHTDIYDRAKLLDAGAKERLEEICRGLRKEKRAQLVVVTLPNLAGGNIDDFAVKLFNRGNKKGGEKSIGDAKLDNGVLLLIALEERKARIEVGDGVEDILTDGLAKRVLEQELFPRFKKKEYQAGIEAAVNRLATILQKAEKAPPDEAMTPGELAQIVLFLSLFVGIGGLLLGAGIGGKKVALIAFGIAFAGMPFMVGAVMASPYSPIFHSFVGLGGFLMGFLSGRNGNWTKPRNKGHWGGMGPTVTPWDWGSLGAGSSFGGGSSSGWSGGGFSSDWGGFGGGSSSGGGASGGW